MPSQFCPGNRVCLYGDFTDTGVLIRPIEQTYPPKWTVELDNGSFEAVNVSDFCLITPNSEQTFHDSAPSEAGY